MFFKKKKQQENDISQKALYPDISEKMKEKLLTLPLFFETYYGSPHFKSCSSKEFISDIHLYQNLFMFFIGNVEFQYTGKNVQDCYNYFYQQYEEAERLIQEDKIKRREQFNQKMAQFISEHSDHLEDFF